jgi:DNA-directed RNA polymerase sigma subunit (sigma70/sigma32)
MVERGQRSGAGVSRAGRGGNASSLDGATVAAVERILGRLPQMERRVVELRFGLAGGHPLSAADVAVQLRLTAREVAEIEQRGLGRLRALLDPAQLAALLARF